MNQRKIKSVFFSLKFHFWILFHIFLVHISTLIWVIVILIDSYKIYKKPNSYKHTNKRANEQNRRNPKEKHQNNNSGTPMENILYAYMEYSPLGGNICSFHASNTRNERWKISTMHEKNSCLFVVKFKTDVVLVLFVRVCVSVYVE